MAEAQTSKDNGQAADQATVRIGTRGSPLALVQARQTAAALETLSGGALRGEIVTFTTTGDQLTTERLINSGGKGLFTKELDVALDDGRIDIAVHSLKDVPSVLPDGQDFLAFPAREDPRDALISPNAACLDDLPHGAILGTASLRREAQTLARRPDLQIVPFRGNVATRMRKLEEGLAAATYLAMAGLNRLGLSEHAHAIDPDEMLPAACQGIICVVGRPDRLSDDMLSACAAYESAGSRRAASAERAFLARLDGSCRTPIAAHLFERPDGLLLRGEVLTPDGSQVWRAEARLAADASIEALIQAGLAVAEEIKADAGGDLPQFVDP